MDALNDRVGGFTECILTMACPVLLAIATKKVDLSSEGNAAVRDSIALLAAISLILCPAAFIALRIASALKIMLNLEDDQVHPVKLWFLRLTKLLAHGSAIGQMVLAYKIYLLITMNSGALSPMWILLVISCAVVFVSWIWSVVRTIENETINVYPESVEDWEAAHDPADDWWNKDRQLSLDLSAAVTSLLFLGLEGLALEGQNSVGKDLNPRLGAPVRVTFACCVVASAVTLVATVPPIDNLDNARKDLVRNVTHVFCAVLAACLAVVVTMILIFVLHSHNNIPDGFAVALVPCAVLFVVYVICVICVPDDHGQDQPPASLEMTKVTFTAFLAISLPSFRDDGGHLSGYTHAFILTAAMSVIFSLGWRFFSHFEQPAAVWTSKFAGVFTHLCVAAAAIELLFMANQALSG